MQWGASGSLPRILSGSWMFLVAGCKKLPDGTSHLVSRNCRKRDKGASYLLSLSLQPPFPQSSKLGIMR